MNLPRSHFICAFGLSLAVAPIANAVDEIHPAGVATAGYVKGRFDVRHPPRMGRDYYPKAALRAHQQGKCQVRVSFDANGDVQDVVLLSSTGYPLLDQASLSAWKPGHVIPAEQDGVPVSGTIDFGVAWVIK
jgi:TonB family protein